MTKFKLIGGPRDGQELNLSPYTVNVGDLVHIVEGDGYTPKDTYIVTKLGSPLDAECYYLPPRPPTPVRKSLWQRIRAWWAT